ncbi:MAG TPA: ATP-binding protein [Candidatus Caccosoma faecigallinarum]|uniref:ATP-binding protein n=1 Tax=Candidatus Caccosoma faecigallinarum TaxID=2840720 RepID=A0A9D1G8U6_9FIRM|nr:ATP-binding protein [Candidatus Caccosoma faecigallinarum]
MEIARNKYLEMLTLRKHNGFIKVITGIRRCGKSYLLNEIFYNDLLKNGIQENHIIKFAFDSAKDLTLIGEDLQKLNKNRQKVNPKKFLEYIESKIVDNNMYYLLLDEVQNLDCFETILNVYLREKNLDVYVTGSNSKFLSKDVLTEFAGRGDEIHVFPLSFSEFYSFSNGNLDYAFDEYMTYGGLPAIALMKTEEQKVNYLKTQIKNVYLKDIVERNHLFSDENIEELLSVIASGIASLTNPSKLANTFKSVKKSTISANTINSYINYMQDAFILSKVNRYDLKGKKYINSPYKIYFEDVGLRNAQLDFRQIENTHLMENVIYNELRYRGYHVDVGVVNTKENKDGIFKRKQLEIDFVANLGSKRYYIQSAYDIPDEEKMQQETKSFDKTRDSFKKIVIVEKSMKPRRTEKGYLMLGIKEFLLNPNSLEL